MKNTLRRTIGAAVVGVGLLLPACDDATTSPSGQAEVLSCNTVRYQGVTISDLSCPRGTDSFTTTIASGGRSFCFSFTCSGGCVSSARVC